MRQYRMDRITVPTSQDTPEGRKEAFAPLEVDGWTVSNFRVGSEDDDEVTLIVTLWREEA